MARFLEARQNLDGGLRLVRPAELAASSADQRILEFDLDFEAATRANRWKWFRYQEDLLDHFMDGLRKAGLNIPVEPAAAE